MKYYYVGTVGGDIITSSPHLDRVMHTLDEWYKQFPKYMKEKIQKNDRIEKLIRASG